MFTKRSKMFTQMLFVVLMSCIGCATFTQTYVPDLNAVNRVRAVEARRLLESFNCVYIAKMKDSREEEFIRIKNINVVKGNLVFAGAKEDAGRSYTVPLKELKVSGGIYGGGGAPTVSLEVPNQRWHITGNCLSDDTRRGTAVVRQIVDAIAMFKQSVSAEMNPQEEARFEQVVQAYHGSATKPVLPEAARKFKIQAESAIQSKHFVDAVDLLEDALYIAPWWPEGHFNRALVLGELGEFEIAIKEMKRYLRLVPDAPDARAAQDKIYVWEWNAK